MSLTQVGASQGTVVDKGNHRVICWINNNPLIPIPNSLLCIFIFTMLISMEEYASLRQEFLKVAKFHITTETLNQLKRDYSAVINSARTLDCITDIEGLVRTLEKRGAIRYNNITPLRHIAKQHLSHSKIVQKLDCYEAWLKSYIPPYLPHTNLYKVENGECRLRKTNIKKRNNSSESSDFNSSFSYNFPCISPLHIIINDDSSNSNNSTVLVSSSMHFQQNANSLIGNVNINSNHNDCDKKNKDCKIFITSCKVNNFPTKKGEISVPDNNSLPSFATSQSDTNNEPQSRHSSTADFNETDRASPHNTPLIIKPRSLNSQTSVWSSSINGSLSPRNASAPSNSKVDLKTAKQRINELIQKRYIKISLIILPFIIILSILLIVYDFKNSVHYNPEPSAPYFTQEVHIGYPGTSSNTPTIYGPPFHPNTYILHNATRPTLPPLQILNERELAVQNKVFEVVSMKLGKHWRDLARCLDIREHDINDIESRHQSQQEKALAALKLFAKETNLDYWQKTLKTALEKARRKDLKEDVEEIISRRF